jgi:hypothetical protein
MHSTFIAYAKRLRVGTGTEKRHFRNAEQHHKKTTEHEEYIFESLLKAPHALHRTIIDDNDLKQKRPLWTASGIRPESASAFAIKTP